MLVWLVSAAALHAQSPTGSLHGTVADPSGAVIPRAVVTATSSTGQKASATTDNVGNYQIKGLAPGQYTVSANAKGFAASAAQTATVAAGRPMKLDIPLAIEVAPEKVEVEAQGTTVDVNPENNASAIIIKGKDLEALSEDPDELQQELLALAGPSAGPNGGEIYIDGFSGGQIPPKSAIREIRINQNPFSAEYDKVGYGRIEIFTKPGTDHFHGHVFADGNSSAFNSQWNPLHTAQPDYHSVLFHGDISGPLGKKASFFFSAQRRNINQNSLVDATVLDSNFNIVPFSEAVQNPRTRTSISPRVDVQLSKNNTLTARYEFEQNNQSNEGVGGFSLVSQAYNDNQTEQSLQLSDTQVISSSVVNETRFQYHRETENQTPQSSGPTISVLQAFTNGGNPQGTVKDTLNRY
ncbi:MAG: carboxypeptidase regulatory-like domain-containing protein [Terriglobales bacterium]